MTNYIENLLIGEGIPIVDLLYLWWNNRERKVYLTVERPPENVTIIIAEDGWTSHGLRLRSFGEIHEDWLHFHQYNDDRIITIFKKIITKQELGKIFSIRRSLESYRKSEG